MSDLFCGAAWRRTCSRSAKSQTTLCTRVCEVFLLTIPLSDTCGVTDCIDEERRKSSPEGDGKHDQSDCKHDVESDRQHVSGIKSHSSLSHDGNLHPVLQFLLDTATSIRYCSMQLA